MLQVTGAIVLLACVMFAIVRLSTADAWVALWLPCIGVGVALTVIGTVLSANNERKHHE